jgi:multidrug efflux system outer membrane protein
MHPTPLPLAILLLAALGGCAVGPRYHPPAEPPAAIPEAANPAFAAEAPGAAWWRTFEDPVLDDLIGRALSRNTDVRIAVARVRESRALFQDAALDQLPRVTSHGTYTRSDEQQPGSGDRRVDLNAAELGFDARWEIDLFGRVSHTVAAAKHEAQASADDLDQARVTVTAEVARNYLALRGAQSRQAVANANAGVERELLRLTELRHQVGSGDPVDVESAKARLAATEATLPALSAEAARDRHRLAVLVGERPGALDAQLAPAAAPAPRATALPLGDVTAVLRRRPDVRAAERRLAAETDRTGVATADLFPRLSISGFVGVLSGNAAHLFSPSGDAWSVTSAVSWPAFDLGGARARLRAAQARGDASRAAYDRAVLEALEDLQDSLVAYRERQSQLLSLAGEVDAARRAADLARVRHKEGSIDFLRVLDADRTRLAAEDDLTQAQTAANTDVVAIYKALGAPEPAAARRPDRATSADSGHLLQSPTTTFRETDRRRAARAAL